MKIGVITLGFFLFILAIFIPVQVCAIDIYNDSMQVKVNLLEQVASVDVTPSLNFGNLTKGYESNNFRVNLTNTGTSDISITPLLNNASEKVFQNLYFQRRTTESYKIIGSFSINLSKPTSIGGTNEDYCYVKLDLTNYAYSINSDTMGHQANIVFWVMPA